MTWINVDTEHEVLEYHNSVYCALIVKFIRLVLASSPHSNHIVVRIDHSLDVVLEAGSWLKGRIFKSGLEHVRWYVVSTLHVNALPIHHKSELASLEFHLN